MADVLLEKRMLQKCPPLFNIWLEMLSPDLRKQLEAYIENNT